MIAVVAVAPVLVVLAWAVVTGIPSPLRSDTPVPALADTVQAARQAQTIPVTIGIVKGSELPLSVPRAGTVTSVTMTPSKRLMPGDVLMTVDDEPLVAFAAAAPLLRPVTAGSKGPDAERAIAFLNAAGLLRATTARHVDGTVTSAIDKLRERTGMTGPAGTLRPEDLIWVGSGPAHLTDMSVRVGQRVKRYQEVAVLEGSSDTVAFATTVAIATDDSGASLTLGGTTVALTAAELQDLRVTQPEDVAALRAELDANPLAAATLRLTEGRRVGVIPATAVITDPHGSHCLVEAATHHPVPVEPLGGSLAAVELDAKLVGRIVLLNPVEVLGEVTCA